MSDRATGPDAAERALSSLIRRHVRVLLAGAPGTGKTTLARRVIAALHARGHGCHCLAADPGQPGPGLPGAVCLALWEGEGWRILRTEALCSLDAARFRLPLLAAVRHLVAEMSPTDPLLVDAPGVVRGAGAAELLPALAEVTGVRAVALLAAPGTRPPLLDEFSALGLAMVPIPPDPDARRPARLAREQRRTVPWDAYLQHAVEQEFDLRRFALIGTPPPQGAPEVWRGRQIGLLDDRGRTVALGEALSLEGPHLRVLAPRPTRIVGAVLVRDACRTAEGRLATAPPPSEPGDAAPPARDAVIHPPCAERTTGPRPTVRTALYSATLVNGVFGDPLLHVRLHNERRSLLFDLGQLDRLPARTVHQVTDVFISHAHFDHIGGFPGLLRARIDDRQPCRLYGPPGLAAHVAGMVSGILWDRAGSRAPRFEVAELHGEQLLKYRVTAGQGAPQSLPAEPALDGVLLREPGLRVRAVVLDHGVPVLAFAFEPARQLKVREERITASGWPPGPWLGELKRRILAGEPDALIVLPTGGTARAGTLAEALTLGQPGSRLVYATDLADTTANRETLAAFARGADILICESPFLLREAAQAARTGHLTTRACGEIAAMAGVDRLIPFHFSRRHIADPVAIYREVHAACPRVIVPPEFRSGIAGTPPDR